MKNFKCLTKHIKMLQALLFHNFINICLTYLISTITHSLKRRTQCTTTNKPSAVQLVQTQQFSKYNRPTHYEIKDNQIL